MSFPLDPQKATTTLWVLAGLGLGRAPGLGWASGSGERSRNVSLNEIQPPARASWFPFGFPLKFQRTPGFMVGSHKTSKLFGHLGVWTWEEAVVGRCFLFLRRPLRMNDPKKCALFPMETGCLGEQVKFGPKLVWPLQLMFYDVQDQWFDNYPGS